MSMNGNNGDAQQSHAGPIRSSKPDDRDKKGPIAAPVKSACTFCRSRKSRCDGNKPCAACVGRGRTDDCIYTVSRRGGKPKPKIDPTQDLQSHLNKLFAMTDMPYAFRRPGGLSAPYGAPTHATIFPTHQMQSHSDIFGVPNQYQSFSQLPMQVQPQLSNRQMQVDPSMQPMQHFQAGSSAGYQLPQQPPQQMQQPQQMMSQPQAQMQSQQQQNHLQQQPPPHGMFQNVSSHTSPSQYAMLPQQHAQQAQHPSPQLSSTEAVSPQDFLSDASLHAKHSPAARSPNQTSNNVQPWGRSEDSMAAYQASSVSVGGGGGGSSARSHSSRHTSTDNAVDAARVFQMSSKTLEAAAAEAGSVKSLLIDYYRYLYRFIPVLPPPQQLDILVQYFKPDSAFIYSLQCVLPLLRDEIQPVGAFHKLSGQGINFGSEEKKAALRERTLSFERKANDGVDRLLEQADRDENGEKHLEVIQTLCVLVVYEYGSGRAIKARLKADQALGLAMAQGLHKLSPKNAPDQTKSAPSSFAYLSTANHPLTSMGVDPQDVFEMRKRCWWSVWSLVLWAAYNTGRIPTIRADDPRVKSDMPKASSPDVWTSNISSLQALLLVQDRVLALANAGQSNGASSGYQPRRDASPSPRNDPSPATSPFSFGRLGVSRAESVSSEDVPTTFSSLPTHASRQEILDSMLEIDQFLQEQIRLMESKDSPDSPLPNEVPQTGNLGHVEKELEDSLRMAAAVQLYTSSLTLHIGQAFQGASLFERKLCFLNSISDNKDGNEVTVCREPMPGLVYDELLDMAQFTGSSSNDGQKADNSTPASSFSSPSSNAQPTSLTQQDLYARGPFLPRLSLQRCVHASRKLLDIAKRRHGQSVNPNPFNCCSFVLISFVLLMQALAVHGGFAGENDQDGENEEMGDDFQQMDGQYANDSLQNLINQTSGQADGDENMNGGHQYTDSMPSASSVDPVKQAQLRDIWSRVREARDTLMDLGKHWEAVIPMADEVNLCLETSQLLLSSY